MSESVGVLTRGGQVPWTEDGIPRRERMQFGDGTRPAEPQSSEAARAWALIKDTTNAAHYLVFDACRNTLQGARGGKGFEPVGQRSGVPVTFAAAAGRTWSDTGQGTLGANCAVWRAGSAQPVRLQRKGTGRGRNRGMQIQSRPSSLWNERVGTADAPPTCGQAYWECHDFASYPRLS
jgi:hypothetical protein